MGRFWTFLCFFLVLFHGNIKGKNTTSQPMACGKRKLHLHFTRSSHQFSVLQDHKIYPKFKAWRSTSRTPSSNLSFLVVWTELGGKKKLIYLIPTPGWLSAPSQIPFPPICSRNLSVPFLPNHLNLSWCRLRICKVGSSILTPSPSPPKIQALRQASSTTSGTGKPWAGSFPPHRTGNEFLSLLWIATLGTSKELPPPCVFWGFGGPF